MACGDIDPRLAASGARPAAGTADSVVKVFNQMRLPNPVRPWVEQNPIEVMGSGVVIARNRILTNAHLVVYEAVRE